MIHHLNGETGVGSRRERQHARVRKPRENLRPQIIDEPGGILCESRRALKKPGGIWVVSKADIGPPFLFGLPPDRDRETPGSCRLRARSSWRSIGDPDRKRKRSKQASEIRGLSPFPMRGQAPGRRISSSQPASCHKHQRAFCSLNTRRKKRVQDTGVALPVGTEGHRETSPPRL